MNRPTKRRDAAAVFLSLALAGCGGGGSETTGPVRQEFTGTVATGEAVANREMSIRCAAARPVTVMTSADGTYSASVPGALPCVFEVRLEDGSSLFSVAERGGTLNVTPITTLAYHLADGDATKISEAKTRSIAALRSELGIVLDHDPFSAPFAADRSGLDLELERLNQRVALLYAAPEGTPGSPLRRFAADIAAARAPGLPAGAQAAKTWFDLVAAQLWPLLTTFHPDAAAFATMDPAPLKARITGTMLAGDWTALAEVPAATLPASTSGAATTLMHLVRFDRATGRIDYDGSRFGEMGWLMLSSTAEHTGTMSGHGVQTAGRWLRAWCEAGNSFATSNAARIGYDTLRTFCTAVGDLADVFQESGILLGPDPEFSAAVTRFRSAWEARFAADPALVRLARDRRLIDLFAGAWRAQRQRAESPFFESGFKTDRTPIYAEYVSLLRLLGYSDQEAVAALGPDPRERCGSTSPPVGPALGEGGLPALRFTTEPAPKQGYPYREYRWTLSTDRENFLAQGSLPNLWLEIAGLPPELRGTGTLSVSPILHDGTVCPAAGSPVTLLPLLDSAE